MLACDRCGKPYAAQQVPDDSGLCDGCRNGHPVAAEQAKNAAAAEAVRQQLPVLGPAPRPCESCPYRRDAPSGLWHPSEYVKLVAYDRPTGEQPVAAFRCHQTANGVARLCAGWVGCHGQELLALRLLAARGRLENPQAVMEYTSPVPLFGSGAEAAAHGVRDLDKPGRQARSAMAKIRRGRKTTKGNP